MLSTCQEHSSFPAAARTALAWVTSVSAFSLVVFLHVRWDHHRGLISGVDPGPTLPSPLWLPLNLSEFVRANSSERHRGLRALFGLRPDPVGFNATGLCRFDKGSRPYHVAVLVPYRDREWNVRPFLAYMHPMLARQCIEYQIFFITQSNDGRLFNRGALFNAGFRLFVAPAADSWDCVILQDLDLLPEGGPGMDRRPHHRCSDRPRALSSSMKYYNFSLPYPEYFGGSVAVTPAQFAAARGFSNAFFGWGGEDDDFYQRVLSVFGGVDREDDPVAGRYWSLPHSKQPPYEDRFKEIERGKVPSARQKGLDTVAFVARERDDGDGVAARNGGINSCSYSSTPGDARRVLFYNCEVEFILPANVTTI